MNKSTGHRDLMKEFNLEPTMRKRVCKRMFPLVYSIYRPRKGNRLIRVNRPFKIVYPNGALSQYDYKYSQGRTNSLTDIGLFEGRADEGWFLRTTDDMLFREGRHRNIIYLS